ncbi:MAG: hypothetical protein ACXVCP_15830 [Bdellovibrio sp.]
MGMLSIFTVRVLFLFTAAIYSRNVFATMPMDLVHNKRPTLGECGYSDMNVAKECPPGTKCDPAQQKCLPDPNSQNNQNNKSNQNSLTDNPMDPACEDQYRNLLQQCQTEIKETGKSCNNQNNSAMNGVINGASAMYTMNQGPTGASQQNCMAAVALKESATTALTSFSSTCEDSINKCSSTCEQLVAAVKANPLCRSNFSLDVDLNSSDGQRKIASAEGEVARCESYREKVDGAKIAMNTFMKTLGEASNCRSALAANTQLAQLPNFCASTPNYPGCNPQAPVDCNAPGSSTNKVCMCTKNPLDPSCFANQKTGSEVSAGGGIGDPSSRVSSAATNGFGGGDIPDLPAIEQGKPNTAAGKPIDGRQGANANFGSDGNSGGGPSGSGSGSGSGGSDSQASSSGFYGSSGATSVYGSDGSHEGQTAASRYAAAIGPAGRAGKNPDLTKYLPGGQYDPRRGISGMSGPDGITGPHSDIWQKITNRYRVTDPTLLP